MSEFVVSARKYRPQTFSTVVGQGSITNTLKNAIKNDHLAQAFLFCGSRGVGKTTTARILAKTINCTSPTEQIEACDQCESCVSFNEGRSLNIHELDAASNNSVDDIRSLIDQVRVLPQLGSYKVYIIDEVHMLSTAAFNAFLKTLEEPPAHAIFILATTEKHKILPTILSRCQIFDFQRIKVKDIAEQLATVAAKEGITADPDALHLIGLKADGAMRDALSMFDQMVSFCGTTITHKAVLENLVILDYDYYFKVVESALKQDIPANLLLFNDVIEKGFDGHHFISGLAEHFRNLLICKDPRTSSLLEVGESAERQYIDQAAKIDQQFALRALGVLSKADVEYKAARNARLLVEMALMQISSILSELEKKCLTDPVEIIPYAGQSLRKDGAPKVNKPAAPAPLPQFNQKKEAKVLSAPTGNLNSTNLSINQRMEFHSQNRAVRNEDLPREPFSKDDIVQHWKKIAHQFRAQDQEQIFLVMTKREPVEIDAATYLFEADNTIQAGRLEAVMEELMGYLRAAVKNYDLRIKIEVAASQAEEAKYLTGKDKFERLARLNTNLLDLKNRFNLDIEP